MTKILKATILYSEVNKISRIDVVAEMSPGDVRTIVATTTPRNGYMHILADADLTQELIEEVADYGMEIHE